MKFSPGRIFKRLLEIMNYQFDAQYKMLIKLVLNINLLPPPANSLRKPNYNKGPFKNHVTRRQEGGFGENFTKVLRRRRGFR